MISTLRDNESTALRDVFRTIGLAQWLLKEFEPNPVAIPLPTFVLRKKVVKSRKPPGVKSAEPF